MIEELVSLNSRAALASLFTFSQLDELARAGALTVRIERETLRAVVERLPVQLELELEV